jgi:hypothetical protein
MYTSNKVMQVCVIKALKVKRYKEKTIPIDFFYKVNLTQIKAAWVQHVLRVFHGKPA